MKTALILLALFLACASADSWFRVANHIGPRLPAAIKFKVCGLGSVYVNGKDTSRIGFGADLPSTEFYSDSVGLCAASWGDKRDDEEDSKRNNKDDETPVTVPADTTANLHVYWSRNADNSLSSPNRVNLRVVDGGILYDLEKGSDLAIKGLDEDVTNGVKNYPTATFSFANDNNFIMQNWWYHDEQVSCSAASSATGANEMVKAYRLNSIRNKQFKTRVRFDFNGQALDGQVQVYLEYNTQAKQMEVHIRGTEGASFNPSFASISVRLTDSSDNVYIDDDRNIGQASVSYRHCGAAPSPASGRSDKPLATIAN